MHGKKSSLRFMNRILAQYQPRAECQSAYQWDNPLYRLISWWEMEQFAAEKFCYIFQNIGEAIEKIKDLPARRQSH
jgi:hypothetical protein